MDRMRSVQVRDRSDSGKSALMGMSQPATPSTLPSLLRRARAMVARTCRVMASVMMSQVMPWDVAAFWYQGRRLGS